VPATHGVLRLVRSAVLAAGCLGLALSAHVVGGGRPPSVPMTLVLVLALTCACVWVTARRVGPVRLGLLLGGSQIALHELFMALTQPAGCAGPLSMAGHSAMPAGCAAPAASVMTMRAPTTAMVLAHVAATTGLGSALWYGERLLWAFLSWAGVTAVRALPRLTSFVATVPTASVRRPRPAPGPLGGVGRRGPPRVAPA
jgi:hypothetical protein